MSLTFACDSCGKSFTLDDKFAGKKGRCKGCGEVMQIPHRSQSPEPALEQRSVRRAVSRPEPVEHAPLADVYGFDEAPLPPRSASTQSEESESVLKPISTAKKKKKSQGFFRSGGKSKSNSSRGGGFLSIDFSSGLGKTIAGLVFTFVILPTLYGLINGVSSRSGIESYYQRQVAMIDELAVLLREVRDVGTATQSSAKINQKLRAITKYTRDNMNRKGKQTDIDTLTQQIQPARDRANQQVIAEIDRLSRIPGAMEALDLNAAILEAAAVDEEIERLKAKNRQ